MKQEYSQFEASLNYITVAQPPTLQKKKKLLQKKSTRPDTSLFPICAFISVFQLFRTVHSDQLSIFFAVTPHISLLYSDLCMSPKVCQTLNGLPSKFLYISAYTASYEIILPNPSKLQSSFTFLQSTHYQVIDYICLFDF